MEIGPDLKTDCAQYPVVAIGAGFPKINENEYRVPACSLQCVNP